MKLHESVLSTIGRTPLVRLRSVVPTGVATLAAKLEYFNPGGSIKDRAALGMVTAAEKSGKLPPGGTIVEATSGNTGYAVAMIAAAKGYRAVIVCSDRVVSEKIRVLEAFGAEVVRVPADAPRGSADHYLSRAERIAEERKGAVFVNQSFNPANPEAHYLTTGPEIWEDSDGQVTCFVSSAGTGGTVSGAGRYLKERNPRIEIVVADPVGSIYKQYVETGQITEPDEYLVEAAGQNEPFIPGAFTPDVVDRVVAVSDHNSFRMARRLAEEEGVFCGMSGGMIVTAAVDMAQERNSGDLVVAVVPDSGDRYLSRLYSDEWLSENVGIRRSNETGRDEETQPA